MLLRFTAHDTTMAWGTVAAPCVNIGMAEGYCVNIHGKMSVLG